MDGEQVDPGPEPQPGATEPGIPEPPATQPGISEPQGPTYPGAEPFTAAGPPPRRGRLRKVFIVAVALVVTGAIAAGAFVFLALRGTGDVIEHMVPGTSTVYFTAYLDPALQQKLNLRSLVKKFPDFSTAAQLNKQISDALDQALEEAGLSSADVMPWLGTQVAIVVRYDGDKPLEALLVASKDDSAAQAALAKIRKGPTGSADSWTEQKHEGITISVGSSEGKPEIVYAFVDHVAILASDPAVVQDVIDTSAGKTTSLVDSADYAAAIESLPKERLALAYVNLKPLVARLKEELISNATFDLTGISSSFGQLDAFTSMGAALSAQSNGLALDLMMKLDPTKLSDEQKAAQALPPHQNAVLDFSPKEAFAVLAGTGFKETMKSALAEMAKDESFPQTDQELGLTKMVDHLTGDYGLEVSPGQDFFAADAALLVGTDDEAGMQSFLDKALTKAGSSVENFGGPPLVWERTSYKGVTITHLAESSAADLGFDPAYAVDSGMAILGSSVQEVMSIVDAKAGGSSVTSADNFASAMAGGAITNSGMLYVNIEAIVQENRDSLSDDDAKNLAPLRAFTFVTTNSPDRVSVRFFLLAR